MANQELVFMGFVIIVLAFMIKAAYEIGNIKRRINNVSK
jgi:Na+-transporting methylmalonyl-CoA/oxaloacetate decarboxylase gamma subunit